MVCGDRFSARYDMTTDVKICMAARFPQQHYYDIILRHDTLLFFYSLRDWTTWRLPTCMCAGATWCFTLSCRICVWNLFAPFIWLYGNWRSAYHELLTAVLHHPKRVTVTRLYILIFHLRSCRLTPLAFEHTSPASLGAHSVAPVTST